MKQNDQLARSHNQQTKFRNMVIETNKHRRAAGPVVRGRHRTRPGVKNSEIIYQNLRQDIIAMELVPGTLLSEKEIALDYGVSRTPVREAILRLSDERLLDVASKSGTYVARIPLSSLREGLVVRRALEAVTVRNATEKATESQITGLQALVQRQQEIDKEGDEEGKEEAFHLADEEFHAAIAVAAGYPGIWDLVQQVKIHVDRYRRLTLPQPGRIEIIIREHADIVNAIASRNPDQAVQCVESHLEKLDLDLTIFEDMWPDYFIHDISLEEERKKSTSPVTSAASTRPKN